MNRERFIALIRTEQKSLRRFLLALCCGNRDEADDIAQDALVKAYLAIDKHEEQGKDTAWLYRIAYNTFLDTSRSRRTLQPIETLNEQPDSSFAADRDFRYQPRSIWLWSSCLPRNAPLFCSTISKAIPSMRLPTSWPQRRMP